jgi:choline dehydrogenase-like flavoprotein
MKDDVVCARVRLQPGSVPRVRAWAAHLHAHRAEALRTLDAEGVAIESVFLESGPDGDSLVYYMRAADIEAAFAVAARSEAAIEQYHREFKQATWLEVTRLELLVDLSS